MHTRISSVDFIICSNKKSTRNTNSKKFTRFLLNGCMYPNNKTQQINSNIVGAYNNMYIYRARTKIQ